MFETRRVIILAIAAAILAASFFIPFNDGSAKPYREVAQLLSEKNTLKQAKIVRGMAEKYGPKETLEILVRSGLPFTGETHLLVHEVGNAAHERFGENALKYCDESFLSACYHGVILNMLGENGLEGVAKMLESCQKEGPVIMTQCTHASGHGFLAWSSYKVFDALALCDKLETLGKDIPVFSCHDGIFMENIFGVHEGRPSINRMVREDDPFYPCNAVSEKYQAGCWANQATLMYQIFQGNLRKVAEHCDRVENPEYLRICYGNFARQIHPLTLGRANLALELCQNATGDWQESCLITLVEAAFSVGDRTQMPYEICASIKPLAREKCYQKISQLVELHQGNKNGRSKAIAQIAETQGVRAAYDSLKANSPNPIESHDLAHFIGALAYNRQGLDGISVCDNQFAFGCFHGFLDKLIREGGEESLKVARQKCLARYPRMQAISCLHGIGHGVYSLKGGLNPALSLCDDFPQVEKLYCYDGVFMEFFTGVMHNSQRPSTSEAEPWKLCLDLDERYQTQCVRNQVFEILGRGKELSRTAQDCLILPNSLKTFCAQSIGLHIAQTPQPLTELCNKFPEPDDRYNCFLSVARELVFQRKAGGEEVCASLSLLWRKQCQNALEELKM